MSRYVTLGDDGLLGLTRSITMQCDVKFDEKEYTLRATEDYEKGDEVYMSYGSHPNDFLLAECEYCSGTLTSIKLIFFKMASSSRRTNQIVSTSMILSSVTLTTRTSRRSYG
jgi:hypothetical protein